MKQKINVQDHHDDIADIAEIETLTAVKTTGETFN